MRLIKPNWYGLDHKAVSAKFEGNPVFLNDFCVRGEYHPSAVYYCDKPNRRKKHRKFVLITRSGDQMFVRGMSPREMEKYRYQSGIHCLLCDDVIYSVNRHDFRGCTCGKVTIDGQGLYKSGFQRRCLVHIGYHRLGHRHDNTDKYQFMKKKDLRVGMIVEDRSDYQQNVRKRPYKLILHINKIGYYYVDSSTRDSFYISTFMNMDPMMHISFHRVCDLKLVR